MRKATFVMSTLTFVASALTLAVVFKSVKKMHDDVEELRAKTNETVGKLKRALVDFSV